MSQSLVESVNLDRKKANKRFRKFFGDDFEEGVVWDPLDIVTSKEKDRLSEMKETYEPVFESLKEKKGQELSESVEELQEEYGTPDKSLPIATKREYFVTERNRTPLYDLLPHDAIAEHKIYEDNVSALGDAGVISETGTYVENDDTIESYEFEVDFIVNRMNEVSDLLEIAEPSSVRDSVVDRQMESIAKLYEKIAIQGSGVSGVSSGSDGRGLEDWIGTSGNTLTSTNDLGRSELRDLTKNLTDFEYDEDQIMVFCSNDRFFNLKAELEQNVRYPDPDVEEAEFGFKQMRVDGVRVYRTSSAALPNDNEVYALVDEAFYWHDLQPPTLHPLAKVNSPSEKFATDSYQQFITRSKDLAYKLSVNQ